MIYLGFPYGSTFGWGILGKEIAFAMAQFAEIRLLSPANTKQRLTDEFELHRIQEILAWPEKDGQRVGNAWQMDGPVIQVAHSGNLLPFVPGLAEPADAAYAVFEQNIWSEPVIAQVRRQYRHLAAGSTYCADVLRQHGLTEVSVVPHGVDTSLFCPRAVRRSFLTDRFLVFSGGKFELRKGQDIVIRAYKVLQDRHQDVMLVNSWHNIWPKLRDTMADSPHIRFLPPPKNKDAPWLDDLLSANGVDLKRVITIQPRNNRLLPDLYHATDLGLFPNRVEGGNNMVLMEYLACGKPALASYNSGHKDILTRDNAVLIETHTPMERFGSGRKVTSVWNDPSLEETIEKLEWCYQNRDKLQTLAQQAATDMRQFPWKRVAEGLLRIVRPTN